jgi:hypothetical protein
MSLLSEALSAAGGLDRWNNITRFTCHMSMTGALIGDKYGPDALKEIVVEGETREQTVRIAGIEGRNRQAVLRPGCLSIEDEDGKVILKRECSRKIASCEHNSPRNRHQRPWDILDLAYFCGYSAWNYMTEPFLLQMDGARTEEVQRPGSAERSPRGLRVAFTGSLVTHSREQTFCFDTQGLLVQLDYCAAELGDVEVSQIVSAHQAFSGVVVPTLRRSRLAGVNHSVSTAVPLVDIEIFDAIYQ